MAVVEVQLGLPPKTNKKKGSITNSRRGNPCHRGDFEIFGKTAVGIERGHCQRKRVNLEDHHSNSNRRFLSKCEKLIMVPCKIAKSFPWGFENH